MHDAEIRASTDPQSDPYHAPRIHQLGRVQGAFDGAYQLQGDGTDWWPSKARIGADGCSIHAALLSAGWRAAA